MNLKFKTLLCAGLMGLAGGANADVEIVVSAKSSVAPLTKQQASDIFLGKIGTFPDGSIAVPIEQPESAAQRDEFHSKVTGRSQSQLKAYWSKQMFSGKGTPPKEVPTAADVKKLIASNPSMIGYVDKGTVDASVKVVFTP